MHAQSLRAFINNTKPLTPIPAPSSSSMVRLRILGYDTSCAYLFSLMPPPLRARSARRATPRGARLKIVQAHTWESCSLKQINKNITHIIGRAWAQSQARLNVGLAIDRSHRYSSDQSDTRAEHRTHTHTAVPFRRCRYVRTWRLTCESRAPSASPCGTNHRGGLSPPPQR